MSRKSVVKAYTLRIELQEVEPLIWRRLLVDGDTTLGKLHHYVQAAMAGRTRICMSSRLAARPMQHRTRMTTRSGTSSMSAESGWTA